MTSSSNNPIFAEVTRGGIVESFHRGAFAVVDSSGALVASAGDIERSIFPRSGIKAFQCLAMLESGAAEQFSLSDEEIATACSSHSGEARHIEVVSSMLQKAGNQSDALECGAHMPIAAEAQGALILQAEEPRRIHNNCSGKHAGMLALARALNVDSSGYVQVEHPVQKAIATAMGALCDCDLSKQPCGIDGCSVPTWAMPLRNMAHGFAQFTDNDNVSARRILDAVRQHPFLVAGTGRFDTELMSAVPRAFIKTGAEGVYGACVPHAGLGIAIKIDDGAKRASELTVARVLANLEVWTSEEQSLLDDRSRDTLFNWDGLEIGGKRALPGDSELR